MKTTIKVLGIIGIVVAVVAIWLGIDYGLWLIYLGTLTRYFHWPALGYWPFFWLLILVSVIAGFFRSSIESRKN